MPTPAVISRRAAAIAGEVGMLKAGLAAPLVALACVSSAAERPQAREGTAVASSPAPESRPAGVQPAPVGSVADDVVPDDAPCSTGSDCTLTRVPAGSCCPTLCEPRAVTARRGAELEAASASCRRCALPSCAPPRTETVAVCDQRRCVTRAQPMQ